ncbi:hypothetical protein ENSA7_09790 [Enhygromyxa salina]|uniref:HEAT repeat protein n=2 Tax=Enhygromyxa salina TaxID=215803 RepID=A0A2S9YW12_9BACT|nr:hypothetical protein ENSA7_09790 [Enhygromyxa salina]
MGASWAIEVTYACRCGVHYRAQRWRWIDRDAMRDEADRARQDGPLRGRCPACGAAAVGRVDWLELEPSVEQAVLVLGAHQRHELVEVLRAHFDAVSQRVAGGEQGVAQAWILRPLWRFEEDETVTAGREYEAELAAASAGVPTLVGANPWPAQVPETEAPNTYLAMLAMDRAIDRGQNQAGAEQQDDEIVTISLDLDDAGHSLWGQAALQIRPIHLRDHGYPLTGVRLVASYLGRIALIDGIVDVGSEEAAHVFASLSRRLRVQLILRGSQGSIGSSAIRREVSARDLERNAALCLESGRAALARSEYPREAFVRALEHLRETPIAERLRGAQQTLVAGAYRHLISPRETWVALDHLEVASNKRNLAHLLEVDGLSVDEYEAIRRRVLLASVEHGLCAPRRFWRRIIASGLADDFDDYATKLARARAEADQDGDDLDSEQRAAGWARIGELCDLKQLEYPVEYSRKIGIEPDRPRRHAGAGAGATSRRRSDPNRSRSAAGEINARDTHVGGAASIRDQLRDPELRLRVATASLGNGGSPEAIDAVFDALEEFDEEELLAIIPSVAELGTQAVSALQTKLESSRQQVRQAAAILLGIARDQSSMVPLLRCLAREETRVWFDVARAIGGLGTSALDRLCALSRQSARGEQFPIQHRELVARIGRAMAEVVIAEGGPESIARDMVDALSQSSETDISVAAGRALATLHDVSVAGAQIRGERSLPDTTQLRGFARRAYEAILVPELDILDEELEAEIL